MLKIAEVVNQIRHCYSLHGDYESAHEAMAVLLEEIDELWDIVKQKPGLRDYKKMESEILDCIVVLQKMHTDIVEKENRR